MCCPSSLLGDGKKEIAVHFGTILMGYATGCFSFLLFGCELPRIFKIPHFVSFSLIGMQFGLNFVGLDSYFCVLGFKVFFFKSSVRILVI